MQGAKERRLRRTNSTPQGEAIEGNTADDALMVDQGTIFQIDIQHLIMYSLSVHSIRRQIWQFIQHIHTHEQN